jgi:hypothetical protein
MRLDAGWHKSHRMPVCASLEKGKWQSRRTIRVNPEKVAPTKFS